MNDSEYASSHLPLLGADFIFPVWFTPNLIN